MLNKIVVMGRIVETPELRTSTSGVPVTFFHVACQRSYLSNGERLTDFLPCVAWRDTAEFINRHFSKGYLIAVEGTLQQRKYVDRDGNNRNEYEISVEQVHMVPVKRDAGPDQGNQGRPQADPPEEEKPIDDDEDLPW